MDKEIFQELVAQARSDKDFFHTLVFEPEKVLSKLESLGRKEKGSIVAQDPGAIVAKLVGVNQACGNTCTSSCDNTCGGSCGFTTNLTGIASRIKNSYYSVESGSLEACGNTCTSSCDNTCGGSCGYTTNLTADPFINVGGGSGGFGGTR